MGWGGSCRGGLGGVLLCNVAVGWGGLCKGGVGYTVVEWAVKSFTE